MDGWTQARAAGLIMKGKPQTEDPTPGSSSMSHLKKSGPGPRASGPFSVPRCPVIPQSLEVPRADEGLCFGSCLHSF